MSREGSGTVAERIAYKYPSGYRTANRRIRVSPEFRSGPVLLAMLAISIGNFDGVHLGHRALLDEARRRAAGGRTVAVTFEPHPLAVLRPAEVPPRLTGRAERARLLREAGADEVLELEPTPDLLGRDPADFVAWLRERVPFTAVVEGADFRFGRGRAGDVAELGRLGTRFGFEVAVVPEVTAILADRTVVRASSSMVRWLLRHGRVADAARLLGAPTNSSPRPSRETGGGDRSACRP
jgi:riboflavin kinase / FMN adenylyltransferase